MSTTHGAEEVRAPMGLLTGPALGAATVGLCLGYGRYLRDGSLRRPAKISCEAHNFVL
jgi:hypothetical protein